MLKSIYYELIGPNCLAQSETELDPGQLRSTELIAETVYSAVSTGTELAAWTGKPPLRPSRAYPRLVGYCNVARVIAAADDVGDIAPGDHILTVQSHRSSFVCSSAEVLYSARGLEPAELAKLSSTYLYHLGYVALLAGGYVPGDELAVIGFGALGFTAASLGAAFAGRPAVFSGRPEAASRLPGVRVLSKAASPTEFQLPVDLDGFDLVINTSDSWDDYRLGLELARTGGKVVLLGFPGRGEPAPDFNPLDSRYLYDKQLTIQQAGHVTDSDCPPVDVRFTLKRNIGYLAGLIRRGVIDPAPLLAMRFDWRNLDRAYDALQKRQTGAFSALIDWTC
jgi:2-desacetyl-2-hydroxyethyl bacteriochlorophyllide A dehydrogenase